MPATLPPLRTIFVVFACCGLATHATAASFDCAKATAPLETAICADPALSAADEKLAERFAAVLARSLDPQGLRAEQREWLTRLRKEAPAGAGLATIYDTRISVLDREIARLDAIADARDTTEAAARSGCPALFDDDKDFVGACDVAEFGDIGAVEGHAYAYGLYAYHAAKGDVVLRTSVVVYARNGDRLHALYAPQEAAGFYATPKLITASGRTVLQLPGYESGTGNFNDERVFVWHDGGWSAADVSAWLADLRHRLPPGYAAWKGVYPDYQKLKAATPLWNEKTDGNCCPTGGRADIVFGWEGNRLAVKAVLVKLGRKYAE